MTTGKGALGLRARKWRLDHGGVTVLEFRQPDQKEPVVQDRAATTGTWEE
jgi:aromatic ring-opening dioxygenase catalytic subunit (LigB family)